LISLIWPIVPPIERIASTALRVASWTPVICWLISSAALVV
jgi:hypothetical protein